MTLRRGLTRKEGGDDGGERNAEADAVEVAIGERVAAMDIGQWLVFRKSKWASVGLVFVASF